MTVQQILDKLKDCHPDDEVLIQIPNAGEMWLFSSIDSLEYTTTDRNERLLVIFPFNGPIGDSGEHGLN